MAENTTSSGIGFGSLLTVLFIGLKLTHIINWSWWWVLAPTWIGALFVLAILFVLLLIAIIAAMVK